ncbi:MAG: hypothetical protein GC162_12180 [Planctomycetes bacterium]|nr:hypothetical protein [Planctomycetota bacterium]
MINERNDKLSFLPEDYVERRIERRTNIICLSLFAVVLAGVVGAYLVTNRHRADVRKQREVINASYTDAAKRLEQLDELHQRKEQMLRKAQITSMLIEPVPRTFLLADLINRMPKSLSLFDLQMASKVVKPVSPVATKSALSQRHKGGLGGYNSNAPDKDKDKKDEEPVPEYIVNVTISGVAPTDVQVAQYLASLQQSALMSDVNLVYSEEIKIDEASMRKFRIDMTLNQHADVRSIDPIEIPRELQKNPMQAQPTIVPSSIHTEPSEPEHQVANGTRAGEE